MLCCVGSNRRDNGIVGTQVPLHPDASARTVRRDQSLIRAGPMAHPELERVADDAWTLDDLSHDVQRTLVRGREPTGQVASPPLLPLGSTERAVVTPSSADPCSTDLRTAPAVANTNRTLS